ncbi:hypothetical protein M434DRAFT_395385 [Hypoxylon sp. CO27-5]|nr:hypothetical protein M434DRAFT_395385 [Hypoxylon sp. CO27-5]
MLFLVFVLFRASYQRVCDLAAAPASPDLPHGIRVCVSRSPPLLFMRASSTLCDKLRSYRTTSRYVLRITDQQIRLSPPNQHPRSNTWFSVGVYLSYACDR